MIAEFGITIRPVELLEVEMLRNLAERTFRDAWQHNNDPEEFELYCRENFTLEKLNAERAIPGAEFYFAWMHDQPAAYLKLNIDRWPNPSADLKSPEDYAGKALQIERIYVLQDFQGQGIGEKLLQFSAARALETGARSLWLSVWQKSPRSIQFYEKNGFSIFGVETFWVGNDPQPDWLMHKQIDD